MQTSMTFRLIWTAFFATAFLLVLATFSDTQPLAQSSEVPDLLQAQSVPSTNGLLDGLQFKAGIVNTEEGSGNALEDTLIFDNGEFLSVVCKRYNFKASPYWVRTDGETIHFLAELTSPTDGKMEWRGAINGDKLNGTMRWTKKRWYWTIDAEHTIEGEVDIGAQSVSASPQ